MAYTASLKLRPLNGEGVITVRRPAGGRPVRVLTDADLRRPYGRPAAATSETTPTPGRHMPVDATGLAWLGILGATPTVVRWLS